ncbi:MAG: PilX N-terminal domain-containing pilus assembly protein [Candidatus Methylomirabilia bacterium]
MKPFEAIRSINSEQGVALVLALLAMLILSLFGLTLLGIGMTEVTIESNWEDYSGAFYAAEAGLESGLVNLRGLLTQTPNPTAADLATIQTPPTLSSSQFSFDTFQVQPAGPTYPTVLASGGFQGLQAFATDYLINAEVSGPGGTKANLTRVLQYVSVPLFQFGAFYGKGVDLEIAPGPLMTFNGPLHANSDIYLAAGSGLNIDAALTSAGKIYRRLKRDAAIPYGNNPQIKDANGAYQTLDFDHDYEPGFANPWSESDWASAANSRFGGQVQDSTMGIQEITPPLPDLFNDPANPDVVSHQLIEPGIPQDSQAMQEAKLYYKAGLRLTQSGQARDENGMPVNLNSCDPNTVTTKTFYDAREGQDVKVTEVDIALLDACGKAPANGILYVDGWDGVPPRGGGVRLVNGSQLPSQGLTVVSEDPVYIQGDYNSIGKVPASVLADAITVLSNNWRPNNSDSVTTDLGADRPASATTVNAAFALGPSAESTLGQGNGQLENVIRFLEDWGGVDFNYSGSIIALWHSQNATAPWACCNYYRPPNRNWSFDPDLNASQPPGAPAGIVLVKGRWSRK